MMTRDPMLMQALVRLQGAAVSVRCAPLLDGPTQDLDVLAVMPAAVYLAARQRRAEVIALLASDAVVHPAAFVIVTPSTREPFADLRPSAPAVASATIGAGRLRVGDLELGVGRWYDPVPRLRVPTADGLAAAARMLRAAGGRSRGDEQRLRLDELAGALADDDAAGAVVAVDALLGSGPGLTPTGDDQLAGLLATLHHLEVDAPQRQAEVTVRAHVRTHARTRTTLLSAALLEHALDGAVAGPVARLLRSLTADAGSDAASIVDQVTQAIDAVLGIGATSGRDLLDGITVAFELAVAARTVRSGTASAAVDEGAS